MNILAHANGTGWDELLLTATPLLLSATVFMVAKKRLGLSSPDHRAHVEPVRIRPN